MEELTLRRGEEGVLRTFVDTTTVGDNRWGPLSSTRTGTQSSMPSTSTSRERRGTMYYKDVELGRAVNICQPSTSRKAKTLWKVREPKAKRDECYERDSERKSESRVAVLQALLEKKTCRVQGWLWTWPCEGRQCWRTVRILLRRRRKQELVCVVF